MVVSRKEIRPNRSSANWLVVSAVDGHVSITRTNADGERVQTLLVHPEEVGGLIDALATAKRSAA